MGGFCWLILFISPCLSVLSIRLSCRPIKDGEPERCIFNEIPAPSRQAEIWYDPGELPTTSTNMMSADWKYGDRKGSPLLYSGRFSRSSIVVAIPCGRHALV